MILVHQDYSSSGDSVVLAVQDQTVFGQLLVLLQQ